MTTLTLISLVNSADKGDLSNLKELKLPEKNIAKIEDIGACKELRKVDLTKNCLDSFVVCFFFFMKNNKIKKIGHFP